MFTSFNVIFGRRGEGRGGLRLRFSHYQIRHRILGSSNVISEGQGLGSFNDILGVKV